MAKLAPEHAEILRSAVRQGLTQILRLRLPGDFDLKPAAPALVHLLTRAADVPDLATLDTFLAETEGQGAHVLQRIVG